MGMSNHERVGRALDLLRAGLVPFVRREMEARHGAGWPEEAMKALRREADWQGRDGELHLDVHALLVIMWHQWHEVFGRVLGHAERSLVSELRDIRNRWAHQEPFSTDDAHRALDSMVRLLTAVSAEEVREIDQMRQELLRVRFEEQARRETKRAAVAPTEGQPAAGLRPWREIVTPHPDVASGRYQMARFAADLAQVHRGEGADEYRDPREFFRRTFLTDGLRDLLKNALLCLSGKRGDPIVELQTNFGGGKTHSMLALYHLFSGAPVSELPGVESVLADTGLGQPPAARRAVLVGTAMSPGQPHQKPDGTEVRTMWGELAWQLGKRDGFALVAQADAQGVNPGSDALRELFSRFGPCLVLIDEWVAFARMLYHVHNLPAGSFDANMTFTQALTEAARQAPHTLVVASIPASDIETGGEAGRAALDRIKNTFGRMEASWRPASAEEGFEIVRRRLFQPIAEPHKFAARDAVVQAFARLYREQSQEFPSNCWKGDYDRRLQAAYPIHPELFDRLYGAWSSLDKFQRTRGVLRLMATIIHGLWERSDANLLILPGTIPVDDPAVQPELTRYLDDNWRPVIEKDVDGPHSLPLALDRDNPNLGRYSASRRVARTIYLGSAPTAAAANPGIDERTIKLGCVQPGENPAIFGDALRRLTDQATHLYVDGSRYWFSTQPSVTRLAQDRAAQRDIHDVWEELKIRLRADRQRGDFTGVHPAPSGGGEVPDEMSARLVILGPDHPHVPKAADSPARVEAEDILNQRGNSPRLFRNMLVFLAPDRTRLNELEQAIRDFLAWDSIFKDHEILNLNAFQKNQAETKRRQANETIDVRIKETHVWLLVPTQREALGPVEWEEIRLQGQDPLAVRASRRLRNDELLITELAPTRLCFDLDRYLWRDTDHLGIKKLWEHLASYIYLPRLRDQGVLRATIQNGIGQLAWSDAFAYAEGWDEARQRYLGLKAGQLGSVIVDGHSLIVKPEAAQRQMAADASAQTTVPPPAGGFEGGGQGDQPATESQPTPPPLPDPAAPPVAAKPRRFYGSVALDTLRLGRDAGRIAEEVVQHLTGLVGAEVEVTLDITARIPDGVSDHVVRTLTENCRTLKFRSQGFEVE